MLLCMIDTLDVFHINELLIDANNHILIKVFRTKVASTQTRYRWPGNKIKLSPDNAALKCWLYFLTILYLFFAFSIERIEVCLYAGFTNLPTIFLKILSFLRLYIAMVAR